MFSNIGWGEVLVLLLVAVVLIGPERLPDAAEALGKALRQARNWLTDAQDVLKDTVDDDLTEDLKTIQKPVQELVKIRTMGPKAAAVHYLLEDDESLLDLDLGLDDVSLDLKELTGLNELDENTFRLDTTGTETSTITASQAVLGTDDVAYYEKVTQVRTTSDPVTTGSTAAGKTPPPAPDAPITVGDSWEEGSEEDVELSFDED